MPLRELVQAAKGEIPFTLAITNAQLVNVVTGEIYPVDVGIYGTQIASVRPAGEMKIRADQVIEANGLYLSPGLIDTHVHIESSMLTPAHFAEAVLPHGTTAVVIDPHEIANVLGLEGGALHAGTVSRPAAQGLRAGSLVRTLGPRAGNIRRCLWRC